MIKTNEPVFYQIESPRKAIVYVEITSYSYSILGKTFKRESSVINEDGGKEVFFTKDNIFKTHQELDVIGSYIEANFDLSGLSDSAKEYKKMQIGLFLDVTTNPYEDGFTIYKTLPSNWEMTE